MFILLELLLVFTEDGSERFAHTGIFHGIQTLFDAFNLECQCFQTLHPRPALDGGRREDFPCHSSLLTNSSNESKSHTVLRTSLPQGSISRAILRDFARFWELRRPSNGLSVNVLISQDMLECALEYRMVQLEYPEKNIDSTTTLRKRRILRALYSSFNCFSNSLPDARIAVQILCHIFLWRRRGGRSM